eukprot:10906390-Karenia_brevis.AAC.1
MLQREALPMGMLRIVGSMDLDDQDLHCSLGSEDRGAGVWELLVHDETCAVCRMKSGVTAACPAETSRCTIALDALIPVEPVKHIAFD